MAMAWIYCGILLISVLSSALLGNGSALSSAVLTGAQSGLQLAFSIGGAICLWSGVGKLMERAGITDLLSRVLQPIVGRLFPGSRKNKDLRNALTANICANLLGLGNAATPMGIRAVKEMTDPSRPGLATDEMCRLIVLNTASIQLIPSNVAAIRASLGSATPFDILPAVWVTSFCSAGLGLASAFLLGKLWRHG